MKRTVISHSEKEKPIEVGIGMSLAGINDIFKGIGNLIEVASEMAEKGPEEIKKTGEAHDGKKAMLGFSVRIGGAGIPKIERFGNIVLETEKGLKVEEVREPFVDVFEEEDKIEAIVELPGVEEKDISYEIKDDVLTLNASGENRKYSKKMKLPAKATLLETVYKNGILRLTMKKEEK